MNSKIIHDSNKFYKVVDGMESVLAYEMNDPSTVIFYHTFVPIELRGRGLSKEIIKEGLEWARDRKYRVIPACSAVRRFIEMNPEYQGTLS